MTNLIQLRPKDFMSKEAIYLNARMLHKANFFKNAKPLIQPETQRAINYLQTIEEEGGGVIYPELMQTMCQILDMKNSNLSAHLPE